MVVAQQVSSVRIRKTFVNKISHNIESDFGLVSLLLVVIVLVERTFKHTTEREREKEKSKQKQGETFLITFSILWLMTKDKAIAHIVVCRRQLLAKTRNW